MKGHTLYDEVEALAALQPQEVEAVLPVLLDGQFSATILIKPA